MTKIDLHTFINNLQKDAEELEKVCKTKERIVVDLEQIVEVLEYKIKKGDIWVRARGMG